MTTRESQCELSITRLVGQELEPQLLTHRTNMRVYTPFPNVAIDCGSQPPSRFEEMTISSVITISNQTSSKQIPQQHKFQQYLFLPVGRKLLTYYLPSVHKTIKFILGFTNTKKAVKFHLNTNVSRIEDIRYFDDSILEIRQRFVTYEHSSVRINETWKNYGICDPQVFITKYKLKSILGMKFTKSSDCCLYSIRIRHRNKVNVLEMPQLYLQYEEKIFTRELKPKDRIPFNVYKQLHGKNINWIEAQKMCQSQHYEFGMCGLLSINSWEELCYLGEKKYLQQANNIAPSGFLGLWKNKVSTNIYNYV